jgi:hypothetical protein
MPLATVENRGASASVTASSAPRIHAVRAGDSEPCQAGRPVTLSDLVNAVALFTGSPSPPRLPARIVRLPAPYAARMTTVRLSMSNEKAKVVPSVLRNDFGRTSL